MSLSVKPYKGARDFYPEDKRRQKFIFNKLREVVEKYGYEEYDAPILEPLSLYLAKTGDEIVNDQTYVFEDRGGRSVVIRPEMTPTVSRMVAARRQELAYPLRWYSIPNLWRYERPQRGRLREHWQLNVDLFGVANQSAEQEIITLADDIFKSFGAKRDMYLIKINSRRFINSVFKDYIGLDNAQAVSMARLIDRMHKIDRSDFVAQVDVICNPTQRQEGRVDRLLNILDVNNLQELPQELQGNSVVTEIQNLIDFLVNSGVSNVKFDATLMRGFDYYTDIVFEVNDTNPDNSRSIMGGGRYDGLVGLFGVEPIPTIGFGLGDVTLTDFLATHKLLPDLPSETDIYVALVKELDNQAQKVINELRSDSLNVAVDISRRNLDKQLAAAGKKGIRYALVIGPQELAENRYTLKNLQTRVEQKHSIARIISIVKDYRNP